MISNDGCVYDQNLCVQVLHQNSSFAHLEVGVLFH